MKGERIFPLFALIVCFIVVANCQSCDPVNVPDCDCPVEDGASLFYSDCPQPLDYIPNNKIQTIPGTLFIDSTGSNYYGRTNGDTVTAFEYLVYGNTYEFSTCDKASTNTKYNGIDTVLVLRDPYGNYLASNDDCVLNSVTQKSSECSLLQYEHLATTFGTVYLSVYKKTYDQAQQRYICTASSSSSKAFASVYAALVDYPSAQSCQFKLTCRSQVSFNQGDTITGSNLIDSAKTDSCNAAYNSALLTIEDSSFYSYYINCESGDFNVTVSLYGETCTSEIYIFPYVPSVGCGYNTDYAYPNHLVSICKFGSECDVDAANYVPWFSIYSSCFEDTYKVDYEYSEAFAQIGDVVDYYMHLTTSSDATVDFTSDEEGFPVIPDEPSLVYDGNYIYYDTIYRLNFYFDIGSDGMIQQQKRDLNIWGVFGLFLNDPTGSYFDQSSGSYTSPEYVYFNDNVDCSIPLFGGSYECETYVDFCIPSSPENEDSQPGAVQSGEPFNLVIATPKLSQSGGTRDEGVTLDYIISLGNPFVSLSVNPDKDNLFTGCSDAFYYLHSP